MLLSQQSKLILLQPLFSVQSKPRTESTTKTTAVGSYQSRLPDYSINAVPVEVASITLAMEYFRYAWMDGDGGHTWLWDSWYRYSMAPDLSLQGTQASLETVPTSACRAAELNHSNVLTA